MSAAHQDLAFSRSRELLDTASRVIPGGVNSNVRMGDRPHPLFFTGADGPYLFDVDGNRIIDYVMGQGPMLLGHRPQFVIDAVTEQMEKGILYGAQHPSEVEVAELVTQMVPSAESVRFNMTGTEAVQAALRVARASTGRNRIVKFSGHYHGWVDSVLYNVASPSDLVLDGPEHEPVPESAGIAPESATDLVIAPWNDADALARIVDPIADTVAAVIMEPVVASSGATPRDGYLEAVRALCDRHGIVLIFDEVITGFRVRPGGAQELYGVTPDLTTMGKAMASGFPIGCLAGRRSIMEGIGSGEITHAGTFNATPISIAAARATLGFLQSGGSEWYASLDKRGGRLMEELTNILRDRGAKFSVQGLPSIFKIMNTEVTGVANHEELLAVVGADWPSLLGMLMRSGVRVSGAGNVFISDAHDDSVIDETLERFDRAVAQFLEAH